MKAPYRLLAALMFATTVTTARAEAASEGSIETLLAVTRSEAMLDSMYAQIEGAMKQGMQQAVAGKPLSPEQQRAMDTLPGKFATLLRQEFTWAILKPQFVQLYRETFEQDEVDGLIAFYRSRAGQAFVNKMPLLMQKSMVIGQNQMQLIMPKLQQLVQESMAEAGIGK